VRRAGLISHPCHEPRLPQYRFLSRLSRRLLSTGNALLGASRRSALERTLRFRLSRSAPRPTVAFAVSRHSSSLEPSRRPLWFVILLLCSMWSGLVITESISNQILPLTLRRFTDDAAIIGYILALNPLFGFIAQPLVGVLSDRIWTPIGRRAFFLVTGAPIVALCLVGVPAAQVFWHLVVLVVVYQFFQDVLWGSDHPLLADLVPVHYRTLATGLMLMSAQAVSWFFSRIAMGQWLELYGEEFLYRFAAIAQLGLVAFAALFLGERRLAVSTRPRLTVRRYLRDFLGEPILRRFGALGFTQYLSQNILQGYLVLFAVETLQISRGDFGRIWSWMPALAFIFALPVGIAAGRWLPKRWTLVAGYVCMLIACVLGWFSRDAGDLLLVVLFFGIGQLVSGVVQKAFFTEFIPRDIIGQLSGTYNVCLAFGRLVALAGGGWIISQLGNDYRVIFPIGFVSGVITIIIVWRIRDITFRTAPAGELPPPRP
jgi:MFS family permease